MRLSKLFPVIGICGLACVSFGATVNAAEPADTSSETAVGETRSPAAASPESINRPDSAPGAKVAETLECPPGQFPSAFRDVYPFHWAYTAVNNLASERMQCFDWPEEYRN